MKKVVETLIAGLGTDVVRTDENTRQQRRHDYWVLSQLDDLQGRPAPSPCCVVRPRSTEEVVQVVKICQHQGGAALVTHGLGSGVCGGIRTEPDVVLLDMGAMNRIVAIDEHNLIGTFEAGVRGSDAEAALVSRGLTCGHYPQSIGISSVGGWVATRSAGQFSTGYGNIEDILLSLEVVLPDGRVLQTRCTPRASAGPDLRQVFTGSEGTLGVITSVGLSLRRAPEMRKLGAFHTPSVDRGLQAQRVIMQSGWSPVVMRQYDEAEVTRLFPAHAREGHGLLLLVHEGPAARVEAECASVAALCETAELSATDTAAAQQWLDDRNHVPTFKEYLDMGVILDTVEIAASWDRIGPIYERVIAELGEVPGMVNASGHTSHAYRSGVNIYLTFAALLEDRSAMASTYRECWRRIMDATVAGGGGVAHHHGIGRVRRDWLRAEVGEAGVHALAGLKSALDPAGIMNPGVLLPDR